MKSEITIVRQLESLPSLRSSFWRLSLVVLGLVACIVVAIQVTLSVARIERSLLDTLEAAGRSAEGPVQAAVYEIDIETLQEIARGLLNLPYAARVVVHDVTSDTTLVDIQRDMIAAPALLFRFLDPIERVIVDPRRATAIGRLVIHPDAAALELAALQALAEALIANIIGILLVSLGLLIVIHRVAVRPAQNLAVFAESLRQREGGDAVPSWSTREYAAVARSLAGLEESLRRQNDQLEIRIAERTRALEESYARLAESERLASLTSVVAGVAHEINTPIGNAVTAASTAQDRLRQLESAMEGKRLHRSDLEAALATFRTGFDMILRNLARASDLINAFREVASDSSGRDMTTVAVLDHVTRVLATLEARLPSRLTVDVQVPADLCLRIPPDVLWLAISNIVMNAAEHAYGETGGHLLIRASKRPNKVKLVFRDKGRGVSKDGLKRIFDPFFTTQRSKGRRGLGLSTVYAAITSLPGARIHAYSEEGEGTTIVLTFPIAMCVSREPSPPQPRAASR